ncbi:lipopolysaccharide biosynthesis protein [Rhodobacter sp. CZR27]|uniref:lipopolysaccharide biosynthesis protein n=1 Tax=Rhodobacter sp. CZR27 TaxID=2033869 RepID=UPI000BBE6D71|nr:lipopolysaccharide biosynthesis protein [Rhodobacter sp. CZR27]
MSMQADLVPAVPVKPVAVTAMPKLQEVRARPDAPGIRKRPRKGGWKLLSFGLFALLPILASTVYWGWLASDRYVTTVGFAVRSMEAPGSGDLLGGLTGFASAGSTSSDSQIVLKFLRSRALVETLDHDLDLHGIYGRTDADFLYRLAPGAGMETLVDYWDGMLVTNYDTASGVIEISVEAFTPEDSEKLAAAVLDETGKLVNRLSETAREDALKSARKESDQAAANFRDIMAKIQAFRAANGEVDPTLSATSQSALIGDLEKNLAAVRVQMDRLPASLPADSPLRIRLGTQEQSLINQIEAQRREDTRSVSLEGLPALLSQYEMLQTDREIAQKWHASALASLEQARLRADAAQRYLAVYAQPSLPQEPLQPRRILCALLSALGILGVWGVVTLLVLSVRDHME